MHPYERRQALIADLKRLLIYKTGVQTGEPVKCNACSTKVPGGGHCGACVEMMLRAVEGYQGDGR